VGGSGNLTLNGQISGSFGLTKAGAGTTTLTAPNAFTGATVVSGGTLDISHRHALGSSPTVTILSGANVLQLDGGITVGGVGLMDNTATTGPTGLQGNTGSNVWSGPVALGVNYARFGSILSGTGLNLTGTVDDGGLGYGIMIRGVAFDGIVQLSGTNTYLGSTAITVGWLRLGNANALPAGTVVGVLNPSSARLDLAGFSPQTAGLVGDGRVVNTAGSLSTLTLNISSTINYSNKLFTATTIPWGWPGSNIFGGTISGEVAVTKAGEPGTVLVFTNANTYRGDTTVASGSLILGPTGGIAGSSNIIVATGATLDTSAKAGGFTLGAAQTLKGNGTVLGNVTAEGTVVPGAAIGTLNFSNNLALQAGSTTASEVRSDGASDQIVCGGTLTYGCTLQVTNLAGTLTTTNTFKLFTADSYSGAFAKVTPPPGAWLAWNTDTLLVDGTLRIATGPALNPTNITAAVIGGDTLQLSWPVDHKGWSLQVQTNSADIGLSINWFTVPGSSAVNELTMPIDPANGSVFIRLVYP
jgi:autotransporter-associated beta strand protein